VLQICIRAIGIVKAIWRLLLSRLEVTLKIYARAGDFLSIVFVKILMVFMGEPMM
jgi:hypothetical protein